MQCKLNAKEHLPESQSPQSNVESRPVSFRWPDFQRLGDNIARIDEQDKQSRASRRESVTQKSKATELNEAVARLKVAAGKTYELPDPNKPSLLSSIILNLGASHLIDLADHRAQRSKKKNQSTADLPKAA